MLKSLFTRIFRRLDSLRVDRLPHHSVHRCLRPWDTVTRPSLMPGGRTPLRASITFR